MLTRTTGLCCLPWRFMSKGLPESQLECTSTACHAVICAHCCSAARILDQSCCSCHTSLTLLQSEFMMISQLCSYSCASGSLAFTLGLVLLLLYRLLVMMIVYNVTMTVVPRVYFLDVGDDFSQLDEASVQHDRQLGAGRPLGRSGCQEGLQGLQQHRHSLCHCRHGLQRSGVTLEAEDNEPPQSLHKNS